MGERVKWATTQDGNCAHAALYSKGVRASVWADGDWRLFDNADSMIANGKAERRTLEAAKLAAEAALCERGLVGGEAAESHLLCGAYLDNMAEMLGLSRDGADDAALRERIEGLLLSPPWVVPNHVSFKCALPSNAAAPREESMATWLRKAPPPEPPRWFADSVHMTAAGFDFAWDAIEGGRREARMVPVAKAFAALAAAMATPQGRRVLAAQAVEEAVADGARRGLDAEALRVALVGAVEAHASGIMVDVSGLVVDAVDNIMQQRRDYPHEREDCDRYRRALAARSAKPLGRPPQRRGVRGREW